MSDFGTMKTRIADETVRDDIPSQITNAIHSAIALWEGHRFFFNEKRLALDTVDGQEFYALSAITEDADGNALASGVAPLEIDSITMLVNGDVWTLTPRTQQWIDREQAPSSQYTGRPTDFAWYGEQIRLFPIPDAAYALTISAKVSLATLIADEDTNDWMVVGRGESLIRNQAKVLLYRDVLRDQEGVALAKDAVLEAMQALSRKTSDKTRSGRVTPWCG